MNYYSFGLSGKHLGPNTAWILRAEAMLVVLTSGAPVISFSTVLFSMHDSSKVSISSSIFLPLLQDRAKQSPRGQKFSAL